MIRDPQWACPRRASGLHRWLKVELGENDYVCALCGARGARSRAGNNTIVQPGQPDAKSGGTRYPTRRDRGIPRSRTVAVKRLTAEKMRELELETPAIPEGVVRPLKRGECRGGERPCPWVSCKHHLYLDVNPVTGSIKFNFPSLEPHELAESCSLDVAERGGHTLDEVGLLMNVTRERIRQVETTALLGPQLAQLKKDAA